ncbi:hypothetical protein [Infirmifilum sp.]|uniref:hypothetical protein n=1 Tax=Infirmifilum sp. TaxID=2856575 RepID=UPI003D10104A
MSETKVRNFLIREERTLDLYTRLISYLASQQGRLAVVSLTKLLKNKRDFTRYIYAWHYFTNIIQRGDVLVDTQNRFWLVKRVFRRRTRKYSVMVFLVRFST